MNPNPLAIAVVSPHSCEQLLIDVLPATQSKWRSRAALVLSPGRAQLARILHEQYGVQQVTAWYLDSFAAQQARGELEPDVDVVCSSDLPEKEFDLVAMPVFKKGEAELTRDLLQQCHARLSLGGYLVASVDNPRDQWLHQQMQVLLDKVTCERGEQGCVYWGRKTRELAKARDFSCEFAFRDADGRLLHAVSRPGVFSHRRLDPGARQLMSAADIGEQDIILDMGCGAGTVAMASALQTRGKVYAVDANARAVECTRRGAALNKIENITTILNADGRLSLPGPIDLALANPPYFGNDAISKHFVDTSLTVLRSGGALIVVTKKPRWYEGYFEGRLEDVAIYESSRYFLACGRKP